MNWFTKLIARLANQRVKSLIRLGLAYTLVIIRKTPAEDVAAAKKMIKDKIQDQRKVPGELRRFACNEVDAIDADDVAAFLLKLDAAFA